MPRYWVIAPVESKPADLYEKVWSFDLVNNVISIGWKELGDVSTMSRDALSIAIAKTYPNKTPPAKGLVGNMIWAFYHEIAAGDFILARRGRKVLAALGTVVKPAYYAPGKNPQHVHPNVLEVIWRKEPRDIDFGSVVFPMYAVAEISKPEFENLLEGKLPETSCDIADQVKDAGAFVLEKYLEEFIVSNFDSIFQGGLRLYEEEGVDAQQYRTEIGPIDILAIEPKSNAFVVIELKKGRPSDQVVGQILRYMGWVKSNLCKDGQLVKGLVICRDRDPKLIYALQMTQNIDVRYYDVSFKLREKL
jgi:restriction system protein